jgi:yeast amino acid transporter
MFGGGRIINCIDVKYFGTVEFYLSIGKVFLVFILFGFTIVTICGGNPINDAHGFRYWNNPGAFAEYLTDGSLGRFWGFLSCMSLATFNVCGPEYMSSVAGETITPRRVLPACYRSYPFRLLFFFVGSALCIGVVIPYNDPTLAAYIDGTLGANAAASPYVIAMQRLKISGLPHVVNAIMMTSVFSCGNGVFFAASRALYVMGKTGRAPKIFAKASFLLFLGPQQFKPPLTPLSNRPRNAAYPSTQQPPAS